MKKPTNRKRTGRPPVPAALRLRPALAIRFTNDERVAIEQAADADRMRLAQWARIVLRKELVRLGLLGSNLDI
jgi:hypothetical protein